MRNSRRAVNRSGLIGGLVVALVISQLLAPVGAALPRGGPLGVRSAEAASATSSRFFPQTGYFIRDRESASFLSEFERLGGIEALGYPVSRVFERRGFLHQAFQRGVLQWRPEAGRAERVNIMDELQAAGIDDWLLSRGIPGHLSGDDGSGGDLNRAMEIRMSWLTEPGIREAYLGHPDPLSFYGLPTSGPERHGPFIAQRFQRGALQLWVDQVDDMPPPGQVVGILAGDLAKESGLIGSQALKPEYADPDASPGEFMLPVPAFKQERNLSCEASAAAMAAAYFGIPLTERRIVAELPLDPNPHKGFRGNIDAWFGGIDEYGVYAEPIADILSRHGLKAEAVYGLSLDGLKNAVDHNRVVISWITYEVAVRSPVVRDMGGEKVVLVPWEHAVAVIGYDDRGVTVNDPATGGTDYYLSEDFARASGYFDGMAVIVYQEGK